MDDLGECSFQECGAQAQIPFLDQEDNVMGGFCNMHAEMIRGGEYDWYRFDEDAGAVRLSGDKGKSV